MKPSLLFLICFVVAASIHAGYSMIRLNDMNSRLRAAEAALFGARTTVPAGTNGAGPATPANDGRPKTSLEERVRRIEADMQLKMRPLGATNRR
jgi:hypothetical protein